MTPVIRRFMSYAHVCGDYYTYLSYYLYCIITLFLLLLIQIIQYNYRYLTIQL